MAVSKVLRSEVIAKLRNYIRSSVRKKKLATAIESSETPYELTKEHQKRIKRKRWGMSEKGRESARKYMASDKFKAAHKKYRYSQKGKAVRKAYVASEAGKASVKKYKQSEKGKEAIKRAYLKRKERRLKDANSETVAP